MRNHRLKTVGLFLTALFMLSVCNVRVASASEPKASSGGEKRGGIAVIMSGPAEDDSWNEAAFIALQALKKQGHRTAYAENTEVADGPRIMREFAQEGYQLVIGHSFNYKDAVVEVGKEFPDVNFVCAAGIGVTGPNVADYDQPFYEAAYLVGIVAGHVSDSGVLGAVYGFDIPVCHAMGEAAVAGAKTVNPDARLLAAAAGDWYDVGKAKEAALAQADAGADFWLGCGPSPTYGTIEAAKATGGYGTGYVGDMTSYSPDAVLLNIIWVLEPLYKDMLHATINGTFEGKMYRYGIAEGALKVTVNPALKHVIPPQALEEMKAAEAKIKSGELVVPFVGE